MRRKSYRRIGDKINRRRKNVRQSGKFKSTFNRDLAAMNHVWRMLKQGTIRAFGEIGRQY